MDIKNAKDYTNPSKTNDEIKIDPAAKMNLGIINPKLGKKDESFGSTPVGNDEDFLKNLDKDLLRSLQSDLVSEVKGSDNKSTMLGDKTKSVSSNLKADEDDSDLDFL